MGDREGVGLGCLFLFLLTLKQTAFNCCPDPCSGVQQSRRHVGPTPGTPRPERDLCGSPQEGLLPKSKNRCTKKPSLRDKGSHQAPGKPAVSSSGFLPAKPQGRERLPGLASGAGKGEEEVGRQDVVEGLCCLESQGSQQKSSSGLCERC